MLDTDYPTARTNVGSTGIWYVFYLTIDTYRFYAPSKSLQIPLLVFKVYLTPRDSKKIPLRNSPKEPMQILTSIRMQQCQCQQQFQGSRRYDNNNNDQADNEALMMMTILMGNE